MSAKTGMNETLQMLERIAQQATSAKEVEEQLTALVADRQAIIDEYNQDDAAVGEEENTAADLGYTLQRDLLQTVLSLVSKQPTLLFGAADEAVAYLIAYFSNTDIELIPLLGVLEQVHRLNKTISDLISEKGTDLLPKKEGEGS